MIQRLLDYARERRIRALGERVTAALQAKDYRTAADFHKAFRTEIFNRSPQQVARLERRRGLVR